MRTGYRDVTDGSRHPAGLPIGRRLAAAVTAAATGFLVTDGAFRLWIGPDDGWGVFFGTVTAVPAGLLAFVRPCGRLAAFILGLVIFATEYVVYWGGPHSPLIIVPVVGLCIAAGAVLAEGSVRLIAR